MNISYHVIIGVGKTTLVQSVCEGLGKQGVKMTGFYTQELRRHDHRRGGSRVGFDVVRLDGQRSPLARLKDSGLDRFMRNACRKTLSNF